MEIAIGLVSGLVIGAILVGAIWHDVDNCIEKAGVWKTRKGRYYRLQEIDPKAAPGKEAW